MAKKVEEAIGWNTRIEAGQVGDFEVFANGELLFSGQESGGYPDEEALIQQLQSLEEK